MKKLITFFFIFSCLTSFGQGQSNDAFDKVSTGTNSYSVTINAITISAPYDGQKIWVRFTNANTGASTLKVTGAGTITYASLPITLNGSALVANDIVINQYVSLIYYLAGTSWQMQKASTTTVIPINTYWETDGNTGLVDATNFIGTTDAIPFNIRVNNQKSGRIESQVATANTFFGYQSGNVNIQFGGGVNNTGIGYQSLIANTVGFYNTAVGHSSLIANIGGTENTAIGNEALIGNTTGTNNTALGAYANVSSSGLTNATAIGSGATVSASNSMVLGNNASVGIGTSTPLAKLHVSGSSGSTIRIVDGNQGASKVLISDADGDGTWTTLSTSATAWQLTGNSGTVDGTNFLGTTDNIPFNIRVNNIASGRIDNTLFSAFYGYQSGLSNTTGQFNTALGNESFKLSTTGNANTAIGFQAMKDWNGIGGTYNTAVGSSAMVRSTTGDENTAIGRAALSDNTGSYNTAVGTNSMLVNTSGVNNTAIGLYSLGANLTASNNTAVGYYALRNSTGASNVALGFQSGDNITTGTLNTIIGYNADASATLTNATALGSNTSVTASNCLVLGNSANVGIGTSAPTSKLHVVGTLTTSPTFYLVGAGITSASDAMRVYSSAGITSMFMIRNDGMVGIGTDAPTATLNIKAGSTAASSAPIKFTSGGLMTSAEVGAMEFLTDKFYGTITTGAARKEFTLSDAALSSGIIPKTTTNGRLTTGLLTDNGTTVTSAGNITSSGFLQATQPTVGSNVLSLSTQTSIGSNAMSYNFRQGEVQTTTTVTATCQTITTFSSSVTFVEATVIGGTNGVSPGEGAAYIITASYRRLSTGAPILIGAVTGTYTAENDATWNATLEISGNNILVRVTGDATGLEWKSTAKIFYTTLGAL